MVEISSRLHWFFPQIFADSREHPNFARVIFKKKWAGFTFVRISPKKSGNLEMYSFNQSGHFSSIFSSKLNKTTSAKHFLHLQMLSISMLNQEYSLILQSNFCLMFTCLLALRNEIVNRLHSTYKYWKCIKIPSIQIKQLLMIETLYKRQKIVET